MASHDIGESCSDLAPLPPKDILLSLRTGKIRPLGGIKMASGINKQPCEGKVKLTMTGFLGDERDYPPHTGPDNAVHQYDPRHYAKWREDLPGRDHRFKVGGFGENISMAQLSENNVCIGDKFRLGGAVIQVTMTRQPCYKLNHRFEYKKMSSFSQRTGRTGWYYRVLEEGEIEQGDEMELIERINPRWSLSRIQHYLYKDKNNMEAIAEIVALPGLSAEFTTLFEKRLAEGAEDMNGRLQGVAMPWATYRLTEKVALTPRVTKFVFHAEDNNIAPEDLQFSRFPHVRLKFGPDLKFTRAYSVVSGDMRSFELGIAQDDNSRGGSTFLHQNLKIGDTLEIAKGHSGTPSKTTPDTHKMRHIFILGGIGVTAFLSEIRLLAKSSSNVEIHYAVRSREEAAYLDQLPQEKTIVYSKVEGQRLNVSTAIPEPKDPSNPEALVYCCGPSSLLNACRDRIQTLGYPRSHVHFEEFGGAATGTGDPFEVEIKTTKEILKVPQEKSLLQVLNEAGFDLDSSCLVGNCGSCMVNYCGGNVVHQGVALDDEQKETTMLSCVSRGKGRIIVDC
ncbi:PK beta-barrel-protein domain-containing protein-like protein [Xylariomycetidae sp. FL2044]|nr:PK beta-barrel-protein domain-containing protein-like protein [Xylariomycetidae sp. FL2044]